MSVKACDESCEYFKQVRVLTKSGHGQPAEVLISQGHKL